MVIMLVEPKSRSDAHRTYSIHPLVNQDSICSPVCNKSRITSTPLKPKRQSPVGPSSVRLHRSCSVQSCLALEAGVSSAAIVRRWVNYMEVSKDIPLPLEKLSLDLVHKPESSISNPRYVVLVSSGSFNPPTYMHLRMFELARDELTARGFVVLGGYLSPVNDAYKKKDLISGTHRIRMCELACKSSSFVMVDPWEANQSSYQRTLTVLSRIQNSLLKSGFIDKGSLKVMLLCGSDLLESFVIPGVWIADQVRSICKDFGVVSIRREGKDIDKVICNNEILSENKNNIISVDEIVPNQISSTRIRDCIRKGLSIKYLIPDEVIEYIKDTELYSSVPDK